MEIEKSADNEENNEQTEAEERDVRVQLFTEYQGLSAQEVIDRRHTFGFNEIQKEKPKNILLIIFEVVKEPIFLMLLACVTLYFILGDIGEALMLLAFILFSIVLTIYQEKKTENAIHALRQLSSPRALVIREGHAHRVAGKEIVPGDFVVVFEGDRVPADGIVCLLYIR
ncbi:MAG: putative cation-translocating P-type ATPase [Streblomastix strix]|uniref:Putative cation-translocating P-type ATPase n=1 Tax=Streblomastix strix TaxID=222440 RepID=A0A5J4UTA8_9EUKA|nr:MAG: putative cation-translocating P-type ATPase [Streblomastix strix]